MNLEEIEVVIPLKNCGCTYSTKYHRVCHDSGPFSSETCVHPRDLDESLLADRIKEEYRTEIRAKKEESLRILNSEEYQNYEQKIQNAIEKNVPKLSLGNDFVKFGSAIKKEFIGQYNFCQNRQGEWFLVKEPHCYTKYPVCMFC